MQRHKIRNRLFASINLHIEIEGIPITKESLAAVCLSMPENNADVKVMPDLETPGKIAKDCVIPMIRISPIVISLKDLFFLP